MENAVAAQLPCDICNLCEKKSLNVESSHHCDECQLYYCGTCWKEHFTSGCRNKNRTLVFICEVCSCTATWQSERGIHFCEGCKTNMCSLCLDRHLKLFPNQTIRLRQSCLKPSLLNRDLEICENHPDAAVEYYCPCNDDVLCAECKQRFHAHCEDVSYISEVCENTPVQDQFRHLTRTTRGLLGRLQEVFGEEDKLIDQKTIALLMAEQLPHLKEAAAVMLSDQEMQQKLSAIFDDEIRHLSGDISVLSECRQRLEASQRRLRQAKQTGKKPLMFLAMKSCSLPDLADDVERVSGHTTKPPAESVDVLEMVGDILQKFRQQDDLVTVNWTASQ